MYTKIIRSGNYLEMYEYERPPYKNRHKRKVKPRIVRSFTRRIDNVWKLQKSFLRLVRSNLVGEEVPCFVTFTMREIVSISVAYGFFTKAVKTLRIDLGGDFRYIAVPEWQKRGAVHFHVLFWGLPVNIVDNERVTRYIANVWGEGFVDLVKTDGSYKIAGYIGKYMSKALYDKRLLGKKAYSCSRNCLRPMSYAGEVCFSDNVRDELGAVDKYIVFQKSFDTMHLGRCDYKLFNFVV